MTGRPGAGPAHGDLDPGDTRAGMPTVLVVASWYPSVDSLTSGRFVADQVDAVRRAAEFNPVVATFDPLALWGSSRLRRREAAAVRAYTQVALASPELAPAAFAGAGPDRAAVARLPVPGNAGGAGRVDRAVDDRAAVLAAAAAAIDGIANRPILVHAHTGYPDGAAAAVEAARRGVPFVLTEHLSTLAAIAADPVRRARYAGALAAAARIIAVSDGLAAELRHLYPESADRLTVIPNVVDVAAFEAPGTEERHADEILFVGNRKPSKGIGLLLEAFSRAHATRPSLRLRLIGAAPGSLDEEWRRRAARLGIADAVALEPEADRAGVAAAMARAGLFVHPSPRETFGVVAAEALAAGLPVVAVDSGGVREVLGHDPARNGALVPGGNADRLAAAILDVLGRRDEFESADLRGRAADRFGPAAVATALADVYRQALAAAPRPSAAAGHPGRSAALVSAPVSAPDAARSSLPAAVERVVREPIVVVGLDRVRAARVVAALPLADRAHVRLVTGEGPLPALPPGLGAVHPVPGFAARHAGRSAVSNALTTGRASRGRWAVLRRPRAVLREAWARMPGPERTLLARASRAVGEAVAAGDRLLVLDGFDALAAEPLVRDRTAAPLPGAGRWLAAVRADSPHSVADATEATTPNDGRSRPDPAAPGSQARSRDAWRDGDDASA